MKIPFKWEKLDAYTSRARVIGGWIVYSGRLDENVNGTSVALSESMVFISDPNHEWEIN